MVSPEMEGERLQRRTNPNILPSAKIWSAFVLFSLIPLPRRLFQFTRPRRREVVGGVALLQRGRTIVVLVCPVRISASRPRLQTRTM